MIGPMPFRLYTPIRASAAPGQCCSLTAGFQRAKAEITAWDGYELTPLRDLPALARAGRVWTSSG